MKISDEEKIKFYFSKYKKQDRMHCCHRVQSGPYKALFINGKEYTDSNFSENYTPGSDDVLVYECNIKPSESEITCKFI